MNLPIKPLTAGDLRELVERQGLVFEDEVTEVDLSVQHLVGPYPTLHAIGLGPQLAELERICAESQRGKHAGGSIIHSPWYHWDKARSHLERGDVPGFDERDSDSGASHLIHAAARLLMAAACADAEGRP